MSGCVIPGNGWMITKKFGSGQIVTHPVIGWFLLEGKEGASLQPMTSDGMQALEESDMAPYILWHPYQLPEPPASVVEALRAGS